MSNDEVLLIKVNTPVAIFSYFCAYAALIADAMELWLETALDHDMTIPEPRMDEDYSGKFVARLSKSLHRKCVERADEDGVSLNQWVVSALSEAVGMAGLKKPLQTDVAHTHRGLHTLKEG